MTTYDRLVSRRRPPVGAHGVLRVHAGADEREVARRPQGTGRWWYMPSASEAEDDAARQHN